MQDLIDLFHHNAWANVKVFELGAGLGPELVKSQAQGTHDTVHTTLAHLARVEYVYLAMIEGRPLEVLEPGDVYREHDLGWFVTHVGDLGEEYRRTLEASTPATLSRNLEIPWFAFPVSTRQGFLQVLTHSAQHRSQALSWLAARGVKTPDLDYVVMLGEARPRA